MFSQANVLHVPSNLRSYLISNHFLLPSSEWTRKSCLLQITFVIRFRASSFLEFFLEYMYNIDQVLN